MPNLTPETDFTPLEQQLNYTFKNKELIVNALTHRSYLNEIKYERKTHNERLEFLGDAVLELVITEHLFENYPDRAEGELTSFRAAIVRTESLAESAKLLGVGDFILMSKGEEASGGRNRPYILANTFEAILGAIYIDSGYVECKKFVHTVLVPKLPGIVEERLDIDPKSKFQEIVQEEYKITPIYEIINETGPDHNRTFTSRVLVHGKEFGVGSGKSKQEAEQNAAKSGLNSLDSVKLLGTSDNV